VTYRTFIHWLVHFLDELLFFLFSFYFRKANGSAVLKSVQISLSACNFVAALKRNEDTHRDIRKAFILKCRAFCISPGYFPYPS
jgi:hypothetical protein